VVRTCNTLWPSLERPLFAKLTVPLIKETEGPSRKNGSGNGENARPNISKLKPDEVKELLLVLARTAESMGDRDHRYANHFQRTHRSAAHHRRP